MLSADPTPTSAAPLACGVTGRRLRVLKGCRRVWCGVPSRARYIDLRAGELWTVEAVRLGDGGAAVGLTRGADRVVLHTLKSAAFEVAA